LLLKKEEYNKQNYNKLEKLLEK